MDSFTRENLRELLAEREGPCLSLFVPAPSGGAERTPARWRSCLAAAEEGLRGIGLRPASVEEFLGPARRLLDEATVQARSGELALFLSRDFQRLYHLPLACREHAAVGRQFLITPLLPLMSGDGIFYVLALSSGKTRLLRCTRETVVPVETPEVPANLEEALATHDVAGPVNVYTRPQGAGRWAGFFHGHGVGIDDVKDDLMLYFRAIDRGLRPLLRERAPLILAAVDYLHPIFRSACRYPGLLAEGLEGCPDRLSDDELRRRAWPLVEPTFRRDEQQGLATYRRLSGTGRTSRAVEELVPAACRGEVETLFVASDREVWGQIDPGSGRVERSDQPVPRDEDLINVAAAGVLRHKGAVYALPAARMPEGEALAGIYWLPRPRR